MGPDEPRYAWIARDMMESGDWITPRLYGSPWFEKPPLYYWGAALSFKLFGVSETTARLPSAIAALLATLALAWLAWRVYGSATARWLLLLLPSSAGNDRLFAFGGDRYAVQRDADVRDGSGGGVAWNGANFERDRGSPIAITRPVFRKTRLLSTAALFGLFLGYAMLAKGPAAIILSGGAVGCWAAYTKRWKDTLRLLHPVAIAVFCIVALPWYVLCAIRNPDFLRVFILEHNFKRFLTPEFQHIQPFWYYGGIVLIAFLPWTPALLWALVVGIRRIAESAND